MRIKYLSGVAAAALAVTSTNALAENSGNPWENDHPILEIDADIDNDVTFESDTDISLTKDVVIDVFLGGGGVINANAAAVATIDNKQLLEDNFLDIEARRGETDSDITNTADGADVNANGNVGLNIATGYLNQQDNVAAIAVSDYDDRSAATGGIAEASLLGVQVSRSNLQEPDQSDDQEFDEDNLIGVVNVNSNGNVGVNVAAGAFNQQKNAMAMAVADNAVLAEANAAVFQSMYQNEVDVNDANNTVRAPIVRGNGNIGINLAAGSMNQQQNALVMAVGSAAAGNGPGGG